MPVNVWFDELEVGQQIPSWTRQTDLMNWNRFAAVNDEFVPMHMDDEAARAAGNAQGAFGMGYLRFAYLLNMLRAWAGDEAEIREVGCHFRAINQKHDTLTCTGTIVEKRIENGEGIVRLEITVTNQHGRSTAPGHAVVALPVRPTLST